MDLLSAAIDGKYNTAHPKGIINPLYCSLCLAVYGTYPFLSGTKLFSDDKGKNEIGMITSGGYSPSLERPISMGYLNHNKFNVDEPIFGEVRNKFFSVTLTKLPFVPTSFKRN